MTDASPRWHVDLPRSWTKQRTGDVLVASAPTAAHGIRPQIVVGVERIPPNVGLDTVATRACATLGDLAEVHRDGDAVDDLGGARTCDGSLERVVRVVSFEAHRSGIDVAVVLSLVARPPSGHAGRAVLQVSATCALDDLAHHAPELTAVIRSARPLPTTRFGDGGLGVID
jgi:hypothetical protein